MSLPIHQAALDNPAMSNALKATGLDKGWALCSLANMVLLSLHQVCKIVSQVRAQMAKFHPVDSWLQSGLWMIDIFSIGKNQAGKGEKSFHNSKIHHSHKIPVSELASKQHTSMFRTKRQSDGAGCTSLGEAWSSFNTSASKVGSGCLTQFCTYHH